MQKILVIDDDGELREMIVSTLRERGFESFEAENGADGIESARTHLPDLIICDETLDKVGGYATLAYLRRDPVTAAIPFIMISSQASEAGMRKGMKLGADDYLPKPFSASELLSAVDARLENKRAQVEQAEKKLADLRANVSLALPHELRTPLTGILGFSEILSTDHDKLQPSEISEMAQSIHEAATNLHRLVENCLIYAQIELLATDHKKLEYLRKRQTENVRAVIEARAREKTKRAGRTGDLALDLNNTTVGISQEYLIKIVDELLENALSFSEPSTSVRVSSSVDTDSFTLSVSDCGRGMTPEQIADIGAYMQFDRKVYEQKGSGLGLTIAKRLAELHGGTLNIQSEVGSGTKVTVQLPRLLDAEERVEPSQESETVTVSAKH